MTAVAIAAYVLSWLGALGAVLVMVRLVVKASTLTFDQQLRGLKRPDDLEQYPAVTIVIPVRNESRNVGPLIDGLLTLDYPRWKAILVDDNSTDDTVAIVRARVGDDPRIELLDLETVAGGDREAFKSGKAYVLSRAATTVQDEWVLFLDADVRVLPDTLWRALAFARLRELPALSSAGFYENPSFLGEVLEAVLYLPVFLAVPVAGVHDPRQRDQGWMNGQFILIRRETYEQLGGHGALAPFAQDDLAFGRLAKARGVPYAYLPDGRLFECVNYQTLDEAHRGWSRLLVAGGPWLNLTRAYYVSVATLVFLIGAFPFFLAPFVFGGLIPPWGPAGAPVWLSLPYVVGAQCGVLLFTHLAGRISMRMRWWGFVFLPLGALLCVRVLLSAYRQRYGAGTYELRGRTLVPDDPTQLLAE